MEKMKAILYYGPGHLEVGEAEKPVAGPGEVVIKVVSATTCGTDLKHYRRGYRTDKPGVVEVFGHECAGTVYEVGEGVTKFKVGERVVAHNSAPCNECYWCKKGQYSLCENLVFAGGAWCEYRLIPAPIVAQNMFHIPDHVSYAMAAIVEPCSCAVYNIAESGIALMDYVCVNGCGPLGLMQIIAAKHRGAIVIATDMSDLRLEAAKKCGADIVVDLKKVEDQVQAVRDLTPDKRGVDCAIDCTGYPEVWEMNVKMVRKGGTVMEFGGCKAGATVTLDCARVHYDQLTIRGLFHTTPDIVRTTFDMICNGLVPEDVFIGGTYPLSKAQEALDSHGRGEVVKNEIRCDIFE